MCRFFFLWGWISTNLLFNVPLKLHVSCGNGALTTSFQYKRTAKTQKYFYLRCRAHIITPCENNRALCCSRKCEDGGFFFNSRCRVAANSLHSKEIGCGFQGESRGWFERGGKKIYLSLQTACAVWAISLFSHPAPFKHAEWSWRRDPLCLTVSVGDLRGGREVIGKCH